MQKRFKESKEKNTKENTKRNKRSKKWLCIYVILVLYKKLRRTNSNIFMVLWM
jgi:hypothetical protein